MATRGTRTVVEPRDGGTPMAVIEVQLLGEVQLQGTDGVVELGGPLVTRLLVALAWESPHAVPIGRLLDEVWPDAAERAVGDRRLRTLVRRLRRVLELCGAADAVATVPGGYRWVDPDLVDAHRFTALVDRGLGLATDVPDQARLALHDALALWYGAPFDTLGEEPWLRSARDGLWQRHAEAVEVLAGLDLDADVSPALVARLRQSAIEEPLRELRWAQLVTALDRSGRSAEALAVYDQAVAVFVEQLGIRPGPVLQEAYELALAHPAPGQSPRTPTPRFGAIIGRDAELAELDALLAVNRLVTVTGLGGIGKSRLVAEIADRWRRRGRLVRELLVRRASTRTELAETLATDAGFAPLPGDDPEAVLASSLVGVDLVVLDTAVASPAVAALVTGLLRRRPNLRIVCASRQAVGIEDETEVHLDGLAVPEPDDPWEGTAVELLLRARGQTVGRQGSLSAAERAALVDTCRLAHGMPLAVELMAKGATGRADGVEPVARIRTSVVELLDTIEPAAVTTARALAWLPVGSDVGLELALGADHGGEQDRRRHLVQLRRVGLADRVAIGATDEHRLPPPIAEAVRSMAPSDAGADPLRSYAASFVRVARRVGFDRPPDYVALGSLQGELENLGAVLSHLRAAGRDADVARVVDAAADLWGLVGATAAGTRAVGDLVDRADGIGGDDDERSDAWRTLLLARIVRFGTAMGDLVDPLDRAIDALAEVDPAAAGAAAGYAALGRAFRWDVAGAAGSLDRARRLVGTTNAWGHAQLDLVEAVLVAAGGDVRGAEERLRAGEVALLDLGDPGGAAMAGYLLGLGRTTVGHGGVEGDLARAHALAEQVGDRPLAASIRLIEAETAAAGSAAAIELFRLAVDDLHRVGLHARAATARRSLGLALLELHRTAEAERELRVAATALLDRRSSGSRLALAGLARCVAGQNPAEAAWLHELARTLVLDVALPHSHATQRWADDLLPDATIEPELVVSDAELAATIDRIAGVALDNP